MRRWLPGATVAVALLVLGGCGGVPTPDPVGTPSVGPRAAAVPDPARDTAFPDETLQDWVTYGDRVAAVEMVAESRGGPTPGAGPSTQRLVRWEPRTVLWSNCDRPGEDLPADGGAGGRTYTSTRSGSGVRPYGGEPVLFVGHTYLAVLAHTALADGPDLPREWVPVIMVPFDDDLVGDGERYGGWEGQEAALDAIWGKTGRQVGALLAATPVDPDARSCLPRDAAPKWQCTATASRR